MELHQKDMEKLENELQTQIKLCNKLTEECEDYKSRIIELEKELTCERRKKEDHVKKIHFEIEKGKYKIRSGICILHGQRHKCSTCQKFGFNLILMFIILSERRSLK